jgi:plastocyanin
MPRLLAIPLTAMLLGGCGAATRTPPSAGVRTVLIQGFKYAPASLAVAAGTKVTWTNRDAAPHTASARGLETGTLTRGTSRTLILSTPGTYRYVCRFHPFMHGTIVVR